MLCTIIRMSFGRLRQILSWTLLVFGGTWAILFAQVWWTCENEPGWKHNIPAQCSLGRQVAIAQVISEYPSGASLSTMTDRDFSGRFL
jgi:hypothetical protein